MLNAEVKVKKDIFNYQEDFMNLLKSGNTYHSSLIKQMSWSHFQILACVAASTAIEEFKNLRFPEIWLSIKFIAF